MPFILRIGYVFIFLCVLASVISFMEKGEKVNVPKPEGSRYKSLLRTSYILFVLALFCFVIGLLYSADYSYLGIESIYTLSMIFLMLGIIVYTNTKIDTADKKSIISDPVLFKTQAAFNVAAGGILAIIGTLYYFFW